MPIRSRSLQAKLLLPLVVGGLVLIAGSVTMMFHVKRENTRAAGLTTASEIAQQIATLRSFYTAEVVSRASKAGMKVNYDFADHEGTLPLPATLVRALGAQLAQDHPGALVRLYSRYPFPKRAATERYDDFELRALTALEKSPASAFSELADVNGRLSMRYAAADVMRPACVACHNSHPESPRTNWREGDVRGAVEVIVPVDRLDSQLLSSTWSLVGIVAASMVFIVAIVILLGRRAIRPLDDIVQLLERVGSGDFSTEARVDASEAKEIYQLGESANRMILRLREIVGDLRNASLQTSEAGEEILASSQQHEHGSAEQLSGFEEIAQTARGNADAARAIAASGDRMRRNAEEVVTAAQAGRNAAERTQQATQEIGRRNQSILERINELYERSQSIIKVVDIIDNISDRLDLLALNAGLEGSRAGEAGRGFTLVAQEMRRLAENVSESTREIKSTLHDIHRFTQAVIEAANHGSEAIRSGVQDATAMSAAITDIVALVEKTAHSVREITVSTQQQLSSTDQMAVAIAQLSSVSSQNLTASQHVTRAATELNEIALRLSEVVDTLRLGDQGGPNGGSRPTNDAAAVVG